MTYILSDKKRAEALRAASMKMPSLALNERQLADLEMILTGAYSPLQTFLNKEDYTSVLSDMRLASGALWPIPVVLDVTPAFAEKLETGQSIALRDQEGLMLAVLVLSEKWQVNKAQEAKAVFATQDETHPGVAQFMHETHEIYLSGKLEGLQTPLHYAFEQYWQTPDQTRALMRRKGWKNMLAFQTSRVVHRAQRDFLRHHAQQNNCAILLRPTVGKTRRGDIEAAARVRCYEAVMPCLEVESQLSLCPMMLRLAGPREALWHAIVEKNYGATHFIIGPNDSSPRNAEGAGLFYAPYAAQALLAQHENEIGIKAICVKEWVYSAKQQKYLSLEDLASNEKGEVFREEALCLAMKNDETLPPWWSFPEVIDALKGVYRPKSKMGLTVFFTGLSGSGKSTLANILNAKLVELGSRPVTLLDGDIVRHNLSNELGFSAAHRNINVKRIGFVANQITRNGGVAICAPIAPYHKIRQAIRDLIQTSGGFVEVYVSTPIEVCEARDVKGLYAKARQGIIPEFTGVSDPYEAPEQAELNINTNEHTPLEAAGIVWNYLIREGYIVP